MITKVKPDDNTKSFSLKELINKAILYIRPSSDQKKIEIFIHVNKEVNLIANPDDFEIIFNNLLSNAVKFNEKSGRVDDIIDEQKDFLEIQIEDTGIGMTMDETAKIFNEFVRIRNEKTKNISGSGLGLSIVKQIVVNYSGNIDVESMPDQGTTIKIRLPKPVETKI